MATATIVSNLQLLSDCEATTGWDSPTELGTIMIAAGTDAVKVGTSAIEVETKNAGVKGARFQISPTAWDVTDGRLLYLWIWVHNPDLVETKANGGVRIYVHDGTNYGFYYIGGSDTDWVGKGWKRVCIDLNRTCDSNSGTEPTKTSIDYVGAAINVVTGGGLGKAAGLYIDQVHRGTHVWITGGSPADPITFDDIMTADTNGYGAVGLNQAGVYELISNIIIGSGATQTNLATKGERICWADNLITSGTNKIVAEEDGTGHTGIYFGESTGWSHTDKNTEVGYNGTTMYDNTSVFKASYQVDFSEGISGMYLFGSTFVGAIEGVHLGTGNNATRSGWRAINTSFVGCGRTVPNDAIVRNCQFNDGRYDPVQNLAPTPTILGNVIWQYGPNTSDIRNSQFLANSFGTDRYAILVSGGNNDVTMDLYGNLFAGNDYDVRFNGDLTETLTVNNFNQSNLATYTAGAGDVVINTAVDVEITVLDAVDNSAVEGARCLCTCESGGDLVGDETPTGITQTTGTATITFSSPHGVPDVAALQRVVVTGVDNSQEYNGTQIVTVASPTTLTYSVATSTPSPATGTIKVSYRVFGGTTDSNGYKSKLGFNYTADQPIKIVARRGSTAPYYKTVTTLGTITNIGFDATAFAVPDGS